MDTRFVGRHALVTGGSRGIGRAVALRLAEEGASVAVNHPGETQAAAATLAELQARSAARGFAGARHLDAPADMGSEAEVGAMVGKVVAAWGRLDILVNNAGIQAPTPGQDYDTGVLERILAVNLLGAAHAARASIHHFLGRPGGGAIVNITSVHEMIPKPGFLAYSISKGGLGIMTRTLALEFADRGIRVNAVGPGAVMTDLNAAWVGVPERQAAVERRIPMGHAARPEEIASAVAFLASDDAAYVTGQTLYVCGGLSLHAQFAQNWAS